MPRHILRLLMLVSAFITLISTPTQAEQKKPNILVIMGYQTPNIDRIGNQGAMFTSWYGQPSCATTSGRSFSRNSGK